MTDQLKDLKIKTGVARRTWKEYLSYKKECDSERRRVEKMTSEGRDEYDLKKAHEVLKETESMISHTKSSFLKAWKEFDNVFNAATHDDSMKQSKEYDEAQKIHEELSKAQKDDQAV